MTPFLHPCPHCRRHIRTDETSCPFCAADTTGAFAAVPAPRLPTARLSRAALLALGTAVSAAPLTACASQDDPGDNTAAGGGMNSGTGGGEATGGTGAGGSGGDQAVAVYGVPASGGMNQGTGGEGTGGQGTGGAVYGTAPVYGIAPDGGAPPK